ncbi:MAG: tetratricopeptide repeat protein [Bdellovibrionales bacterium]
MTFLYIVMAVLCAAVVIKAVSGLRDRDVRLRWLVMLTLPGLSLPLYLTLGAPDQRGQPVIFSDLIERDMRQMALLAERPMETILEKNPNDGAALASLGKISARLGKHAAAEKFFMRALPNLQKDSDAYAFTLLDLGQTQIALANGRVPPATVTLFEELRIVNPRSNLSRHYLALAKAQNGQHAEALKEWTSLLRDVPGNIYWKKDVRTEMAKSRAALREKPASAQ